MGKLVRNLSTQEDIDWWDAVQRAADLVDKKPELPNTGNPVRDEIFRDDDES